MEVCERCQHIVCLLHYQLCLLGVLQISTACQRFFVVPRSMMKLLGRSLFLWVAVTVCCDFFLQLFLNFKHRCALSYFEDTIYLFNSHIEIHWGRYNHDTWCLMIIPPQLSSSCGNLFFDSLSRIIDLLPISPPRPRNAFYQLCSQLPN